MQLRVLYFQALRRSTGLEQEHLAIPEGSSVEEALNEIFRRHPELLPWRSSLGLAVNEEWAKTSQPLRDGDCLALLPPVSGG